ncbi:MAG TPA: hypothetical protein VEW68_02035 [Patescibacteria group bacterium]|nr:hypothetical protein [Patescibacteria group bacterium]
MSRAVASIVVCSFFLVAAACESSSSHVPTVVSAGGVQHGQVLQVQVGDVVQVILSSTAWTFDAPSDPSVLKLLGDPVIAPGTCPPGMGCGSVIAKFGALKPGKAVVTASRASCGEALRCVGDQGTYDLTVMVS